MFKVIEVGRSQSFLTLRRGLFAGISARKNPKLGRSPRDFAPKGFLPKDRNRPRDLALGAQQLTALADQGGGDLQKISTGMRNRMKRLTGRHGLF